MAEDDSAEDRDAHLGELRKRAAALSERLREATRKAEETYADAEELYRQFIEDRKRRGKS